MKRLRYCDYLGKYFCDCCHSYAETCIPARILSAWDFRKYYVSNFSKRLLDGMWHQPVFNLLSIGHCLYAKAKELDRARVSSCLCGTGGARCTVSGTQMDPARRGFTASSWSLSVRALSKALYPICYLCIVLHFIHSF